MYSFLSMSLFALRNLFLQRNLFMISLRNALVIKGAWLASTYFFSLERLRGFTPYVWTNVRQCQLTCTGFSERAFNLWKLLLV